MMVEITTICDSILYKVSFLFFEGTYILSPVCIVAIYSRTIFGFSIKTEAKVRPTIKLGSRWVVKNNKFTKFYTLKH